MFQMDPYSTYYNVRRGSNSFVSDFIKVRYRIGESTYTTTVTDVTPKEIEDIWVFELSQNITNAEEISLVISIRGEQYIMKVK